MWRPSHPRQRVRVPDMSETMRDTMERELQEAIDMLNRANSALERIFNTDEREGEEE